MRALVKHLSERSDMIHLIISEILKERSSSGMSEKDTKHFLTGVRKQFLCVAAVCDRFTFLGIPVNAQHAALMLQCTKYAQ